MGMAGGGWYPDPQPEGEPGLRYWDGQSWTAHTRPGQPETATKRTVVAPRERRSLVRLPTRTIIWVVLLTLAALGILWGAAEHHDHACYSKPAAQVATGNREGADCFLPWTIRSANGSADAPALTTLQPTVAAV